MAAYSNSSTPSVFFLASNHQIGVVDMRNNAVQVISNKTAGAVQALHHHPTAQPFAFACTTTSHVDICDQRYHRSGGLSVARWQHCQGEHCAPELLDWALAGPAVAPDVDWPGAAWVVTASKRSAKVFGYQEGSGALYSPLGPRDRLKQQRWAAELPVPCQLQGPGAPGWTLSTVRPPGAVKRPSRFP